MIHKAAFYQFPETGTGKVRFFLFKGVNMQIIYYDPDYLQVISDERQMLGLPASFVELESVENHQSVSGIIKKLSPKQKRVINYVMKGFSDKEIANKMKLECSTVRVHKSRAIEKLKKLIFPTIQNK